MKVVILAGGLGTRMGSETTDIPKPMVPIGGRPIIWHIMKYYSHFGHNEFIICLGYKGEVIKDYFEDYCRNEQEAIILSTRCKKTRMFIDGALPKEDWDITLVNTGSDTTTGGRIKRAEKWIRIDGTFLLTYGDGLSNVNLDELIAFHKSHKNSIATVTAIQPSGKFGTMHLTESGCVQQFVEKPKNESDWINGGFCVMNTDIFHYLERDGDYLEGKPFETLVEQGKLAAYPHTGFWKPVDSPKDKKELEEMWNSGNAPWKVWND